MSEPTPPASLWHRWVVAPIRAQLSQGTDPRKIALAIAFGVTLGLFPLLGTPTLLAFFVGFLLRLNQPILQVFRELTYPLQLATVLIFIHAGESLFRVSHTPLSIPQLMERFRSSPSKFMTDFGMLGIYAVSVWVLLAPVLLVSIYFISKPIITGFSKRFSHPTDAL